MMELFHFRHLKINSVIKQLIWADLALLSGWGLVEPVFAIFILEKIQGATIVTVGIAAAIYWLVKSVLQMPISLLLDKIQGEKDDYMVLVLGLVLSGLSAFSLVLVDQIWQLYLMKFIQAIGFALYIPSWYSIFSRHLDKEHRSFEFSLNSTTIGIAAGIMGLLSGIFVKLFGFTLIFVIASVFSLVAAAIIFFVPEIVFPHHSPKKYIMGDHTAKDINK